MNEEFIFLLERLVPALNKGVLVSLQLIVPSAILGIFFGVVVGACRAFGGRFLGALANGYAALFRGTPLVIQLFILYFGLPNVGIYFQPYTAAVLGFTLCSAAYHSEYIRGGLLSIKRGQVLAAQALGFSTFTTWSGSSFPRPFAGRCRVAERDRVPDQVLLPGLRHHLLRADRAGQDRGQREFSLQRGVHGRGRLLPHPGQRGVLRSAQIGEKAGDSRLRPLAGPGPGFIHAAGLLPAAFIPGFSFWEKTGYT